MIIYQFRKLLLQPSSGGPLKKTQISCICWASSIIRTSRVTISLGDDAGSSKQWLCSTQHK